MLGATFMDTHHINDGGEYELLVSHHGKPLAKGRFCLLRMGSTEGSMY
jgi:hypothetical protein